MKALVLALSLLSFPAFAQEHCISPDAIRSHVGDAMLADLKSPGRELIALAAPGEQVMLLIFHDDECAPSMARIPAELFQDLAAFIGGQQA